MKVEERFLTYVAYPTMSDENSPTCPSTEKQRFLAKALDAELRALGLCDVKTDENGYVTATLPANAEGFPNTVGLIAHMDTSDAAPDAPIKPRTVEYEGGDILLNSDLGIYLTEREYPYLSGYKGQHLIVTDGTTLLGADDKAGIAEIVTALERLITSNIPHGKVRVAFTPDEEIGRDGERFDVPAFGADFAYTVDGGALGELEYETFNAASATVTVNGVSIHPGSAKGRMKNAALIAFEYNALLPKDEIPAKTEGYEGFYHLTDLSGDVEKARLSYIIRDHDRAVFESRKETMLRAADTINAQYGEGTVAVKLTDSYYNMRERIEPCMYIVECAKEAMTALGVKPICQPIRGGTTGAHLSFMGLPCPNLCTGGENFHSRFEFVSVESMERVTDILCKLIPLAGRANAEADQ